MQGVQSLIFLAFLIAIFYLLLIRPQKRRVEQHRKLVQATEVGDEVVTIGGIHGIVVEIGDEEVSLEVAPGTRIRFVKSAIARRIVEEDYLEEDEDLDEDEAAAQSGDEEA